MLSFKLKKNRIEEIISSKMGLNNIFIGDDRQASHAFELIIYHIGLSSKLKIINAMLNTDDMVVFDFVSLDDVNFIESIKIFNDFLA